jgi:hypothetical protein
VDPVHAVFNTILNTSKHTASAQLNSETKYQTAHHFTILRMTLNSISWTSVKNSNPRSQRQSSYPHKTFYACNAIWVITDNGVSQSQIYVLPHWVVMYKKGVQEIHSLPVSSEVLYLFY